VVVVDEIVSQLISRCVQQPGIWGVFDELLRLHAGNSVYIRDYPELTGVPLGELQSRLPGAVLLGRISRGSPQAELLPDPAATLAEGDQLVLIASQFANTGPRDPDSSLPPRGKRITRQSDPAPRKLLVLGWSRKVPPLLSDLIKHYKDAITVDAVGLSSIEERKQQLAYCGHGTELANVRMVEANFLVMDTLTSLRPQDYDAVIVVARENLESNENADASSVTTQLALHRIFRESQQRPHLLFEILDDANRRLFSDSQDDVMVSPMLVSYMLSQVALRRELGAVFDVLSHSGGPELTLVPAAGYLPCNEPVCFSDIQRAAHEHGEIALGLRIEHQGNRRVVLNPDRSGHWQLADGDQLIVLADFPEEAS
jgi:Trk K+ transport system NAD-binding subunit